MTPHKVDFSKLQDLKCSCGNAMFTQAFFLKRVPALLIGATVDDAVPIPVYQCTKCKNVLDLGKAMQKAAQNALIDSTKF